MNVPVLVVIVIALAIVDVIVVHRMIARHWRYMRAIQAGTAYIDASGVYREVAQDDAPAPKP